MPNSSEIQADTIRHKMRAVLDSIIEQVTDDDEALEKRNPAALDFEDGFTVSMPAGLSYYWSTGTGTPLQDRCIQRCIDAQAAEWALQFPQRAPMEDCASNEGEHSEEAQEWETAALEDETIWLRVEIVRTAGDIALKACFTDEINAPIEFEWRESISEEDFLGLDGQGLDDLVSLIAEAPYWAIITEQRADGVWLGWLGTSDGKERHYSTNGHSTELQAFDAVKWASRR